MMSDVLFELKNQVHCSTRDACRPTRLRMERESKRCSSPPFTVARLVGDRTGLSVMAPGHCVALGILTRLSVVAAR